MSLTLSALTIHTLHNDPVIMGLTSDSRSVRKGYLFVALSGARSDGRAYIKEAIAHGARAVVTDASTARPDRLDDETEINWNEIAWIIDENPRLFLARAAAIFYHAQPETIFAVTGTNGKTSTVSFVRQILQKMNIRAVSLGTLGIEGIEVNNVNYASMTTPDPVQLHAQLADLAAASITHVAMEASSHGLHQHRLDGVKIFAGAFTNLTHDHLDYHGSMENYRAAKLRLFSDLIAKDGVAVINSDSDDYARIQDICHARNLKMITYGRSASDLIIHNLTAMPHGTKLNASIMGQAIEFTLPFVGEFQIYNILCAVGLVLARCPKRLQEVIDIIPNLTGIKGRLEFVKGNKVDSPAVYVDYAHTPDALKNILTALRPHAGENGRLIIVFGCGGDRDRTKREVMGRIANELSDIVIVTDDNPRSEDPAEIRASIIKGVDNAVNIGGRRDAIITAISMAKPKDIIVIAGKGHEQGQIIGDIVEPFDDVTEALNALNN
jgi:UDP-N-acetylmuramoyl-L-alanyl-D-glutamate--2,6-diaminopimelate ligase